MIQAKIILLILITLFIAGTIYYILEYNLNNDGKKTIPRFTSIWNMGKGNEYEPIMEYSINDYDLDQQLLIVIRLEKTQSDNNLIHINIINNKNNIVSPEYTLQLTDDYIIKNHDNDQIRLYTNVLKDTIFSKRNISSQPKYLIHDSSWGNTFVGKLTPSLKVINNKTQFNFGKLNTFEVNYEIGANSNAFFIVDNMAIPTMATYYDIDGNLLHSYELLSLTINYAPLYNLYTFANSQSEKPMISSVHLHHK